MTRRILGLMAILGCAQSAPPSALPTAETLTFSFRPPPIYALWAAQAESCAERLARRDTSFRLDRHVNVRRIEWRTVPTQRADGQFWLNGHLLLGLRAGPIGHDTIYLSGQQLNVARLVKHEVLHIKVESPGENHSGHGPPWGLCDEGGDSQPAKPWTR